MGSNDTASPVRMPNPLRYLCSVCDRHHLSDAFPTRSVQPALQPVATPARKPVVSPAGQAGLRRELPAGPSRGFRFSLKVKSRHLKSSDLLITAPPDGLRRTRRGDHVVDFLRFSHDVTLFRVALPLGGTLAIKDRHFKTLRVASSPTGDFLLREPLFVEAGEFCRILLVPRATGTPDHCRGSSWKRKSRDVTAECGVRVTAAG
ncbi:uncharacterized protein LOC143025296 [Oratosquilla oratoria]|uniref:uncharacterized protein LOC143025296 n=1 Tax=Oratosquilla oratoria TaxID=337810 RepID=UPI003F770A3F